MALRIVLLGAPGAGKGTQAKRLADSHGLPHISTGDIFRANLKAGTPLGKKAQEYMSRGALVPDELTCEIVADRLAQADCAPGYILDGFPRSVPQAEMLETFLNARGEQLTVAIDIAVADEEIVGRLAARRTCAVCGAIYNLKYDRLADASRCGKEGCTGELTQREDDREETIRARLKVYHDTTEPIIGFYGERGILKSVSGDGETPDGVYRKIEEVLSALAAA